MPSPSRATANGRDTLSAFATEFGEETCLVMACPPKEAVSLQLFVVGRPRLPTVRREPRGGHLIAIFGALDTIRSFGLVVFIGITRMALQTLWQENRKRC